MSCIYDHPSRVPRHKGVMLKRSSCPSFAVCLHEYCQEHICPSAVPSTASPPSLSLFLQAFLSTKTVSQSVPAFPRFLSFPLLSFIVKFCPETLFQGALKPVICCGYRSCFLAIPWGWPPESMVTITQDLPKPTLLTLPSLEVQDFQFPVLEMTKLQFVKHLILGWKGVFSGLMELVCLDTARPKPLALGI